MNKPRVILSVAKYLVVCGFYSWDPSACGLRMTESPYLSEHFWRVGRWRLKPSFLQKKQGLASWHKGLLSGGLIIFYNTHTQPFTPGKQLLLSCLASGNVLKNSLKIKKKAPKR